MFFLRGKEKTDIFSNDMPKKSVVINAIPYGLSVSVFVFFPYSRNKDGRRLPVSGIGASPARMSFMISYPASVCFIGK